MWCTGSDEAEVVRWMHRSSIRPIRALVTALALLNGCRSRPQEDPPAPVTNLSHAMPPQDAAKNPDADAGDIACKGMWECPDLPLTASCVYECDVGACRLWYKNVAKAGAGPCYGNSFGDGMLMETSGPAPFRVACNLIAGFHCDMKSHRCVETKARGSRCEEHDECGAYDQCTKGRCTAGAKVGAKCWSTHCEKGAFCSVHSGRCEPLLDLGAECLHDTECQSGTCRGHCAPPREPIPCPTPQPAWSE